MTRQPTVEENFPRDVGAVIFTVLIGVGIGALLADYSKSEIHKRRKARRRRA